MTPTRSAPPRVIEASFAAGAPRLDDLPAPTGIEIAFAGRSNVGKSTLMNALMRRKNLVRTSSTPGCTRQISLFEAKTADGAVLTLADLPGYGYAKRSKTERESWAGAIEAYLLERPSLVAVVTLVDARRGMQDSDRDLLELVGSPARVTRRPLEVLVVATKTDKLKQAEHKTALGALRDGVEHRVVPFSSRSDTGADDVWRALRGQLGLDS